MKVCVKSDVGLVRQINQDSHQTGTFRLVATDPSETCDTVELLAVADGMGGYQAGEVASRLALDTVNEQVGEALKAGQEPQAALEAAMAEANRRIIRQGLTDPECAGMGTTVTVALVCGLTLYLGHVGDSRAYIVRGGRLEQVTRDHSLVGELVRNGDLTEAEARVHPQRNIVTQAFGSDLRVRADIGTRRLEHGDLLLLCSDGLTGALMPSEMEEALASASSLDEACERLVAMANDRGGYDNVTVMLAGPVQAPAAGPAAEPAGPGQTAGPAELQTTSGPTDPDPSGAAGGDSE